MTIRTIYLLHGDDDFRRRLQAAVGASGDVLPLRGWADVRRLAQGGPGRLVVVVDPYAGSQGDGPSPELRRLLCAAPELSVIAALDTRAIPRSHLLTLGEWGVGDVLCTRTDPAPVLRATLDKARSGALERLMRRALPRGLSRFAQMVLSYAAEVAVEGGGVPELAERLHLSERTLLRRCEELGLPGPRRLLLWLRLLAAADLLDDSHRTVENVALTLGYATTSSFRRALVQALGMGPGELRTSGAVRTVAAAFRALLDGDGDAGAHEEDVEG